MEVARTAGEEALKLNQGETASWDAIGRDALHSGLPTHTPYVDGVEYDESKDSAVPPEEVTRGAAKAVPKGKEGGEMLPDKVAATVRAIQ